VVDSKTKKIVGILNGIGEGKDRIALAVPVKELSDFVTRAQPYLQVTLFPKTVLISPVAADLYPALHMASHRRSFAAPPGAAGSSQAAALGAVARRLDA